MKKNLFPLLCCLCIMFGCTDSRIYEETVKNQPKQTRSVTTNRMFEFPPIQWDTFETYQQKVDACQIPDSLLPLLPTAELVQICMEYPLLMDAYAFDTPVKGMKEIICRFNGLTELLSRKDNCICLFEYLMQPDLRQAELMSFDEIAIGRKTLYYALGEILLSHESILKNASEALLKSIAFFSYQTLENKEADRKHHGLFSISTSAYLCANTLFANPRQRSTSPSLSSFLSTGRIQDDIQLQEIKNLCKNSIK